MSKNLYAVRSTAIVPSVIDATLNPASTSGANVFNHAASCGENPSSTRQAASGGVAHSRNGIRRPRRERYRSLHVLMTATITADMTSMIVPVVNPIRNPDAPYFFICNGTTFGTTPKSIKCRQKSPHSIHRNTFDSPPRVYVSVPTRQTRRPAESYSRTGAGGGDVVAGAAELIGPTSYDS